MQALIKRELRNTAPVLVVALVAYFLAFAQGMGVVDLSGTNPYDMVSVPFYMSDTFAAAVLVGGVFATVLGLRQATADLSAGTALFLLHRPVDRRQLFVLKIVVGLGAFAAVTTIPFVVYLVRAAVPGYDAAPFRWWMITGPLVSLVSLTCIYLASLLSGLREGRWYGTRLLPIAGAALVAIVAVEVGHGTFEYGVLVSLALIGLADWLIAQAVMQTVETREYR